MKPLKSVTTSLSSVILFSRLMDRTVGFYTQVLGLKVIRHSKRLVELQDSCNMKIIIKKAEEQSVMSRGYSPVLSFSVVNFQAVCQRVKGYNLPLDGGIISTQQLKLATFRGIDGEMIVITKQAEETAKEQVKGEQDAESEEIRRILRKIKL